MKGLHLFDDARARAWTPFAETRPVGELLYGCLLLRERASRSFSLPCAGHVTGPELSGFAEPGAPPTREAAEVGSEGTRVLLSSRVAPRGRVQLPEPPATLVVGGRTVGWVLGDGEPVPADEALLAPEDVGPTGEVASLEAELLEWPWDLVAGNADRIAWDVEMLFSHGDSFQLDRAHVLGNHRVSMGRNVTVEPGVVVDVREGPVRLADGARIQGPARLTGPLYVGPESLVFGGDLTHASVGPVCKVRGEIEASVLLGYCNKAHEGYLGHAYLGRWVNLGALTTNSDLKNSYSAVRVPTGPEETVDTGLLKVGAFLGDHVKTGIGTLLNTGTVIGAGSNVFGGAMPPSWVPPFSWGVGDDLVEYRLDKFLEVAAAAMARRDQGLDDAARDVLTRAWERTRIQRGEGS